MTLEEFLETTQARVRSEIEARISGETTSYPHAESVFTEIVMQHMADIGMTGDPELCHVSLKLGNQKLRLSGYAVMDEGERLDLFVSLYEGATGLREIPDADAQTAIKHCLSFLGACADGKLLEKIDTSTEAYALAVTIRDAYPTLDQIRVFVLTDRRAKNRHFVAKEIGGKLIRLEMMDIERLFRHLSEGSPRDELVINFADVCGAPLPCVYVPDEQSGYDYALTAIPGEALRLLYERFSTRLLEANVRSFLNSTNKVNKGIRDTLKSQPDRFLAYNNGIVIVADEAVMQPSVTGHDCIAALKGMQIVNGGQTTASIYFSKRKDPSINLAPVRVPAKIIILKSRNGTAEENLISDISRFANSQSAVKVSDLSANQPYHVELERLSQTVYCPDGEQKWFYERASGSYATMLALNGKTAAQLAKLKKEIPSTKRITKTDLAKYLNTWDQLPHVVSKGSQKNFAEFMERLTETDSKTFTGSNRPDVQTWKHAVAKAILFKRTSALMRTRFLSFQANVTTYVIALLAHKLGSRISLDRVWEAQSISHGLRRQIETWSDEINKHLHDSARGKMISEWAKRPECWQAIREASYSPAITSDITEIGA